MSFGRPHLSRAWFIPSWILESEHSYALCSLLTHEISKIFVMMFCLTFLALRVYIIPPPLFFLSWPWDYFWFKKKLLKILALVLLADFLIFLTSPYKMPPVGNNNFSHCNNLGTFWNFLYETNPLTKKQRTNKKPKYFEKLILILL